METQKCECTYIDEKNVMPGWGCCICHTYNGMQRQVCKHCGHARHPIVPPEGIIQCPVCGWAWEKKCPPDVVVSTKQCPSCAYEGKTTSVADLLAP